MKERKCEKCGASLDNEDVMKLKFEGGSCHVIPLPLCPDCFSEQIAGQARSVEQLITNETLIHRWSK